MAFLGELREAAVLQKRQVRIDFGKTRQMTAGGTLLFAAELNRINILAKCRRVSCTFPKNKVVAQVLKHVGLFEMLRQRRSCQITAKNVKYWRVHSGSEVDGEQAGEAISEYGNLFSDPEKKSLYRGLTEAMTNCHHWAYLSPRGDGLGDVKRWWMFTELADGKLTVAICDLGMGIPRSLREDWSGMRQKAQTVLAKLGLSQTDAYLIRAAMEIGRSRTKEENRGKGMNDIRTVLDALRGTLHIHSGAGQYFYDAEREEETIKDVKVSIQGTLVLWRVPVPEPKSDVTGIVE